MNSPLISIIIPTYNSGTTITACLESLALQKFIDFETVFIDGLSTDETINIIKSYQKKNLEITLISEKDDGIYDAMNKGIKIAKGEWVYFLGSDDTFINEDSLKKISEHLNDSWDVIYGDTIWVPEHFVDTGVKDLFHLLRAGINHQRVFYRKNLFLKFGYYRTDYKIASDFEMNIRLFCDLDIRKKYEPVPIAYYYSGGISANNIDENFWRDWKINLLKNFSAYLPSKQIYQGLHWYCWYLMRQRRYIESLDLFVRIYFTGFSFLFLKHTLSQALKMAKGRVAGR